MSDNITQESPKEWNGSKFLAILVVIAIFLPHTLEITWANAIDNSYLRVAVYAAFWMVSLETGSTIAGPYSSSFFEVLTVRILVFCVLFLPLYLLVIIAKWRFMKGISSKITILRTIGIALITQTFILFAFFWYQLDGWAFGQSYPLPILHALIVLSVVQQSKIVSKAELGFQDLPSKPRNESSLHSAASDSIVTSCVWCVSLVFLTGGILLVFNFLSARLLQPAFAFSQLLMGLGSLAIAIIVIIVRVRSDIGQ